MNERAKLLNWECLWSDLVQEEISRNAKDGNSSKGDDEEIFALNGKGNKGKGKKSQSKPESNQGGKNNDLSKNKCFHCHEFRHYAMKCPHKNTSNKTSGGETSEALDS